MTDTNKTPAAGLDAGQTRTKLAPAALRALAEAEARRKLYLEQEAARPKEIGGRKGGDPVRYGDWEIKGLASDF